MHSRMNTLLRRQSGMTLAELMIAMTLGLMITLGMAQLFVQSKVSFNQDELIARMQEDARFAVSEFGREIAMAGFYASLLDPSGIVVDAATSLDTDCGPAGFAGQWMYDFSGPVAHADNPTAADAAAAFSCIDSADFQPGTDILAIKRVEGGTTDAVDLDDGNIYLQTNGTVGYVFEQPMPAPPDLAVPAPNAFWQYTPSIYYIRNYSVTAGDGVPALCRKVLTDVGGVHMVDECIAEGVEDMQLEFGVDTDGDGVANQYDPDPAAGMMTEIVAIRIFFLGRSIEDDQNYSNDKTYTLSNAPVFVPQDNFYRRVFTTTILLRNPVNLNKLGSS